jgi:hypothetical protein
MSSPGLISRTASKVAGCPLQARCPGGSGRRSRPGPDRPEDEAEGGEEAEVIGRTHAGPIASSCAGSPYRRPDGRRRATERSGSPAPCAASRPACRSLGADHARPPDPPPALAATARTPRGSAVGHQRPPCSWRLARYRVGQDLGGCRECGDRNRAVDLERPEQRARSRSAGSRLDALGRARRSAPRSPPAPWRRRVANRPRRDRSATPPRDPDPSPSVQF